MGIALTSECARRSTCCEHLGAKAFLSVLGRTQESGLKKCLYQDVRSNLCSVGVRLGRRSGATMTQSHINRAQIGTYRLVQ